MSNKKVNIVILFSVLVLGLFGFSYAQETTPSTEGGTNIESSNSTNASSSDPFADNGNTSGSDNSDPFADNSSTSGGDSSDPFADSGNDSSNSGGSSDPFAGDNNGGDPFGGDSNGGSTSNNGGDPFGGDTNSGGSSDPFGGDTNNGGGDNAATLVSDVPGDITADGNDNTSTLSITIPTAIVNNPTSKARVSVQFCFFEGGTCSSVSSLNSQLQSELKDSSMKMIRIVDKNTGADKELKSMKVIYRDVSGESIQLTKLPKNEQEGSVPVYESSIELGEYDSVFSSDLIVEMSASPILAEYAAKAEKGIPFARIVITDSVNNNTQSIPVILQKPVVIDNKEPVKEDKPAKKVVVNTDTGVESYLIFILLGISLVAGLFYRKINSKE